MPAPDTKIPADAKTINVSGYAWSGGGRGRLKFTIKLIFFKIKAL